MDVEEVKNYLNKKIEADNLVKQVRKKIKEYTWQKQDQREGFTETFKPLISQFEKPEDPKTQNIFSQNQKMLQNQLALTEGIRANQKAITDGFSQFERLADMQELPGVEDREDDKDDQARASIVKLDLEKNFNKEDIMTIEDKDFIRPNDFYETSSEKLKDNLKKLTAEIASLNGRITGRKRKNFPDESYLNTTRIYEKEKESLMKYRNITRDYLTSLNYKVGQGLFSSPQELLQRFELLKGSLAAGNNGVLPEFIQIAHYLRNHGILSNRQLNALIRKVI